MAVWERIRPKGAVLQKDQKLIDESEQTFQSSNFPGTLHYLTGKQNHPKLFQRSGKSG